jgi:hypothetical protein
VDPVGQVAVVRAADVDPVGQVAVVRAAVVDPVGQVAVVRAADAVPAVNDVDDDQGAKKKIQVWSSVL